VLRLRTCGRRRGMRGFHASGTIEIAGGHGVGRGAADWLGLAAAPAFAIMALLTGVLGGEQPDVLCVATGRMPLLSGMIPMYLLVSIVHLPPWLRLVPGARCRWWFPARSAPLDGESGSR